MKKLLALTCLAVLAGLSIYFLMDKKEKKPAGDGPVQFARLSPPLSFEPNMGQAGPDDSINGLNQVKFISRTGKSIIAFKEKELEIGGKDLSIKMALSGANGAKIKSEEKHAGISNYYRGNDPAKWLTGVPHYGRLVYEEVYPGIDLAFYGNEGRLEYDFIVKPGANPAQIEIALAGATLETDKKGNLLLQGDKVFFSAPKMYQVNGQTREPVKGSFLLKGKDRVAFEVASYDPQKTLVIDPELVFSTFLGGSVADEGRDIAVLNENAYVTGVSFSLDFPFQSQNQGGDIFVTKFSADGRSLVYSTFIGGAAEDAGNGIAVDGAGNAYVTGASRSLALSFPEINPLALRGPLGGADCFILRLNPAGVLDFSSLFGGPADDVAQDVVVDGTGNLHVTGVTNSVTEFPVRNPVPGQSQSNGTPDAFVAKFNPSGLSSYDTVFSTYLGGSVQDEGSRIALDSSGNIFVTGFTASRPEGFFPLSNPFQATLRGLTDAFITKFSPDGDILYSTYFGGDGDEEGNGIAIDGSGIYLTGSTSSVTSFPLRGGFDTTYNGGFDAFVTKLNPEGSALIYSTFLGGVNDDEAMDIKIDATGLAYITGRTNSINTFPSVDSLQGLIGGTNVFLSKINADGDDLIFSTQLGGNLDDEGLGLFIDASGNAYVTGFTLSPDFIKTAGAFDTDWSGNKDAFVIKASLNNAPTAPVLVTPQDDAVDVPTTTEFGWLASTDADGDPVSYEITFCPNSLPFEDCTPQPVGELASIKKNLFFAGLPFFAVFGLLIPGKGWKRRILLIGALLLAAAFVASCGGGGGDDEKEVTPEVTFPATLEPATTYHWRVEAFDNKGESTLSEIREFTTVNPTL